MISLYRIFLTGQPNSAQAMLTEVDVVKRVHHFLEDAALWNHRLAEIYTWVVIP